MKLHLVPQMRSDELSLIRSGDTLTINGAVLDLSILPEGAEITRENSRALHPMIAGPIMRVDGGVHVTLILPFKRGDDNFVDLPRSLEVTEDGPVDLPFCSYSETDQVKVEGGTNIVTTTYRWRQDPQVSTEFVPDPPPEPETEGDDNGQD